MPIESGLIAYAALANFAVARKKYRPSPPLPRTAPPKAARAIGILLLLLSVIVAVGRFGGAQGVVFWTGQLCMAGIALVLLMSWRPRIALTLALPALVLATIAASFGN